METLNLILIILEIILMITLTFATIKLYSKKQGNKSIIIINIILIIWAIIMIIWLIL